MGSKHVTRLFDKTSGCIALFILTLALFFWILIPPMQSPDEHSHIAGVYLFSKGMVIPESPDGVTFGGKVDTGLKEYIQAYYGIGLKPQRKLLANEIMDARSIQWTGEREFQAIPGGGFYFPIIYVPHGLSMIIGEGLGLSVDSTYRLTRFMALVASTLLLLAAFKTYPVNPLVVALLLLPMTLFQMFSPTLDGISTALSILIISLFLRIDKEREQTQPWIVYTLIFSIFVLVSARINLLPFLLFILAAGFYTKNKKYSYWFYGILLLIVIWVLIAVATTTSAKALGASSTDIIKYYLSQPWLFVQVLWDTLAEPDMLKSYIGSFIGVLGWLDTVFPTIVYVILLALLILIGVFSTSLKNLRTHWTARALLLFSAIISFLLIFCALLATWTPHPAEFIVGVQGRYFLIPVITFAYALAGDLNFNEGLKRKIAVVILVLFAAISIFATAALLLNRYYLGNMAVISQTVCENGSIDNITQEEGQLFVRGWVLLSQENVADALFINLTNDQGDQIEIKTDKEIRSDVAQALKNPKLDDAGFQVKTDVSTLKGDYILTIAYLYQDKRGTCTQFNVPVSMNP